VLTRDNIDYFFDNLQNKNGIGQEEKYELVKENHYFPLLKYLVRNGYIDESYQDYMTYFYENSLTKNDKIFLRSVTDKKAKEFSYELKNPELVLSRLRPSDFDQPETLNFDLLCFLLKTKHNFLERLIIQLKSKKRFDFISQFFNKGTEIEPFIKVLNHFWLHVYKEMLMSDEVSDQQRQKYVTYTLCYSPDDDIKRMNENNCLTDYISQNPDFLSIENPEIDKICTKLILLNVRFENINYNVTNTGLFRLVYEANLYSLNIPMITLILNKVYGISKNEDYKYKNYSLIISKPNERLTQYVKKNIVSYFDVMIDSCESTITDNEQVALDILNNNDIDLERKCLYIEYLQTVIKNIKDVNSMELWSELLNKQKVEYLANNILQYFFNFKNKLDDILIGFINGNSKNILFDYDKIKNEFDQEKTSAFYKSVIQCKDIDDKKYEMILKKFNRYYTEFSFKGLPKEKMKILIGYSIIQMNKANLFFMRANYPNELIEFIISDINPYINEINTETFNLDELIDLLEEKSVSDENKIKLLSHTKEPILITDKNYSEHVKLHLLKNNFDEVDIQFLVTNYDKETQNIKIEIEKLCQENIQPLINENISLSPNLLSLLCSNDKIPQDKRIYLLINALPNLELKQAKKCFTRLKMSDFMSLFEGKRPKIEKKAYTEKLLSALQEKSWISSYKLDGEDTNFYQVFGKNNKEM
jgi:hypothetical protein